MRRLNDEDIAAIRQQANIVDVISSYISLHQAGNNYKAVCPFHDDTNPSLSVNPQKQIFKCFACGQGGNVFTFVRDYENISFIEAVIKVGDMVGFDLSNYSIDSYKPKIDKQIERYLNIMQEAQSYAAFNLGHSKDEIVKDFLKQRDLNSDIVKTFGLGYIDPKFPLTTYLLKKGFSKEELNQVNLAGLNESGLYDVFNHRILFPIRNHQHQVVAFTARALNDEMVKYINSATSPIYQKAQILYNYTMANHRDYKDKPLIVCEGVMDVIAFYKSGYSKVVATLGTSLSDDQIKLIKRMNCDVILAYDGDQAGQSATLQIGSQLKKEHLSVSVYSNDTTLDPDDIISTKSIDRLVAMIEKPKHWMEFILDYAQSLYSLSSYSARKEVVAFSLKHLQYEDKIDQNYFVGQLSTLTQFDSQSIVAQLKTSIMTPTVKPQRQIKQESSTTQILQSEKQILAHLLEGKNYAQQFKVKLGYLCDVQANDLALLILSLYNVHDTINVADCLNLNLSETQQSLLLEVSEDPLYQTQKSEQHLNELMIQVQLADIANLLQANQNKISRSIDNNEKMQLLNEKIELLKRQEELRMENSDEKL